MKGLNVKMQRQETKPIKILVVSSLEIGGIEIMMLNIQKKIDRERINFDYLVYHDYKTPLENQVIEMGSIKRIASADKIKFRPLRQLIRMNKIRKICKENKVDILHYNISALCELTNILAAKLGKVKYVTLHSHNSNLNKKKDYRYLIGILFKPIAVLLCDNFWACSELAAQFMFPSYIIKNHRYKIIKNGIDLQKYDFNAKIRNEVRKELGLEKKFVVGHTGRFVIAKNHRFLLDVFKRVYEKNSDAVLTLFGDGEMMDEIKKKAESLGLSKVVLFYGICNQMERMYQAMDVFVMPSFFEGLPIVGIEAQSSGLRMVLSDSITKEVDVCGKAKFLSLDAPIEDWADEILAHKSEERKGEIEKLNQAGYDIGEVADMFCSFYTDVAKNKC